MKNYLIVICIFIIFIFLVTGLIFGYLYYTNKLKKQETKFTEKLDKVTTDYDKLLEIEKNKKPITIKEYKILKDEEKKKLILNYRRNIKKI